MVDERESEALADRDTDLLVGKAEKAFARCDPQPEACHLALQGVQSGDHCGGGGQVVANYTKGRLVHTRLLEVPRFRGKQILQASSGKDVVRLRR